MQVNNRISLLKEYIKDKIGDDCGNWEYMHRPYIKSVVGSLNEKESIEFSQVIWDWKNSFIYELADAILSSGNKYLQEDYLYCKIFSIIEEFESLEYLAENLGACFYLLKPEEYDIEMFKKMRVNLQIVLEKTIYNDWKEKYRELIASLDAQISL